MYLDSKTEITVDLTPKEVNRIKELYDKHVTDDFIFGQILITLGATNDGVSCASAVLRIYGEDVDGKNIQRTFEIREYEGGD
jgi:hypothetical protein